MKTRQTRQRLSNPGIGFAIDTVKLEDSGRAEMANELRTALSSVTFAASFARQTAFEGMRLELANAEKAIAALKAML